MRTDHIVALEKGDFAPFPAPVYIRGSVRTYAKLLKLDVMKIMDDLAVEMSDQGRPEESAQGRGHRRGILDVLALQLARLGWKWSVVLLLIISAVLFLFLFRFVLEREPTEDPLTNLPPPAYQPTRASDGGYLPLPGTNR